jgi:hypothetical protein
MKEAPKEQRIILLSRKKDRKIIDLGQSFV